MNAQRQPQQTRFISEDGPTEVDKTSQLHFGEVIESFNLEESQEEAQKREFVLTELASLCQDWVTAVSRSKKNHDYVRDVSVAKVFTFGSYRLGTHVRGTDIDMLLITPRHIDRQDFFTTFYKRLQVHPKINKLTKIDRAYVPIMKFTMDGVDIDLLYAQLQKDIIDTDKFDILDNRHLKNLDQKSVLSMNGPRVAAQILRLVPNPQTYRQSLRLIKLWAKRRCIYSNVMGYLGGVSWAILVARVCQLYPNLNASALVVRFFRFCCCWEFGWLHPIALCPVERIPEIGHVVWDPQYNPREKYDLMPIITPAYPAMNSTHNVSNSTFAILKAEFERANSILNPETSSSGPITVQMWKELLKEKTFFANHKHFLEVKIAASTAVEDLALSWKGFVEAKIRTFVQRLEETDDCKVFPNPNSMQRIQSGIKETFWWIGLDLKSKTQYNMSGAVKGFLNTVRNSELCESSGGELKVDIRHVKYKDVCTYDFIPKVWKKRRKSKKKGVTKVKSSVVRLDGPRPNILALAHQGPDNPKVESPSIPSNEATQGGSVPVQHASLPENPKGAVNPVPLNHVNGPIKGPPPQGNPNSASEQVSAVCYDEKMTALPPSEYEIMIKSNTNSTPSPARMKRKSSPPSDQPPAKKPRLDEQKQQDPPASRPTLANIPRPQSNRQHKRRRNLYRSQSVFDLDIDAAKMLEWLTAVAKWSNYDWDSIKTEFEAMVQAFVHHLSSKMDNQECFRKIFARYGWKNWKFSKKLKQKTFETMAQEVERLMASLKSRTLF